LKDAPIGLNQFGIAPIDDERVLLVAGLETTVNHKKKVHIYNIKEDTWTNGPSLPKSGKS